MSSKLISGLLLLSLFFGCDKGKELDNLSPDTNMTIESINLSGENRLNSLVEVKWWGTDPDGFVTSYEFSFDQVTWYETLEQDSLFRFSITEGSDTIDIDFWVRSIDNEEAIDETPAYLKIPLKNTPPEVEFVDELAPIDSVFNLLTIAWEAMDLDGFSSVRTIELKLNESDWLAFSPRINSEGIEIASIEPEDPEAKGVTNTILKSESGEDIGVLEGLKIDALNDLYLRVTDLAGYISREDTLSQFYFKGKSNDLLVIGTSSDNPTSFYKSNLNAINVGFDFIDMVSNDRVNLPKIWNPYFELLLRQYSKVLIYCTEDILTNPQTNQEDIFLEFAAGSIEKYVNNGGKIWIVSSMPNLHSPTSVLYGILPMDSLSSSPLPSQARLPTDSLAVGSFGYPSLTSNALITIDPFYASSDAEVIYSAQLTKSLGWYGPEDGCIGARRKTAGVTSMVFMSVDLHKLDQDQLAVQMLFDKIINQEF